MLWYVAWCEWLKLNVPLPAPQDWVFGWQLGKRISVVGRTPAEAKHACSMSEIKLNQLIYKSHQCCIGSAHSFVMFHITTGPVYGFRTYFHEQLLNKKNTNHFREWRVFLCVNTDLFCAGNEDHGLSLEKISRIPCRAVLRPNRNSAWGGSMGTWTWEVCVSPSTSFDHFRESLRPSSARLGQYLIPKGGENEACGAYGAPKVISLDRFGDVYIRKRSVKDVELPITTC